MTRQVLSDGSGRWFDLNQVEKFDEETRWNGSNHISCATGSQWEHQTLYRTKSRLWIIHAWSQWQGTLDSWTEISDDEAAIWLVENEHEHPDVEEQIAELEI